MYVFFTFYECICSENEYTKALHTSLVFTSAPSWDRTVSVQLRPRLRERHLGDALHNGRLTPFSTSGRRDPVHKLPPLDISFFLKDYKDICLCWE